MLILEYIYYRFYKLAIKTEKAWGKAGAPVWTAIFTLSILFFFNIISIAIIYSSSVKKSILPDSLNPIVGVFSAIIIFTIGYFLFDYNEKYLKIEKKFDSLPRSKKKIYNILFWLYIIITFSVMFILIPATISPVSRK